MSALAGALIAGGASSRFGQDKASLAWDGGTLAAHLLREMAAAGLKPLYYNAAAPLPDLPPGLPCLPDTLAGQGPLGGLAAVLKAAGVPVLIAACDMPGLDAEAFRGLAAAWKPGMPGLVARSADGWHPLLGIYSQELLPEIERRLGAGQRAMHRLVEDEGLLPWSGAKAAWLANVNSPAEWEAWKRLMGGG